MVELPPAVLRPFFDASLVRGAVVRLESYPLKRGPRDKYFAVLNIDCGQELIYHALTTSQIERYRALPFADDGVFIPQSTVPCFHLPTIIDCHSLGPPLSRETLFTGFCARTARIFDPLPREFMAQVDAILKRSRLIAPSVKAMVLTEY